MVRVGVSFFRTSRCIGLSLFLSLLPLCSFSENKTLASDYFPQKNHTFFPLYYPGSYCPAGSSAVTSCPAGTIPSTGCFDYMPFRFPFSEKQKQSLLIGITCILSVLTRGFYCRSCILLVIPQFVLRFVTRLYLSRRISFLADMLHVPYGRQHQDCCSTLGLQSSVCNFNVRSRTRVGRRESYHYAIK